jgi:hypothetical protein
MRRRHVILIVIAVLIPAAGIAGVIIVRCLELNLEDLTFRELNLSSMPDGT